jgi:hypothetical protein
MCESDIKILLNHFLLNINNFDVYNEFNKYT